MVTLEALIDAREAGNVDSMVLFLKPIFPPLATCR